jgi:uncharacterized membrane protein YgcG
MKKGLLAVVFFIGGLLFWHDSAYAADYKITNYQSDVAIQADGSAQITTTLKYYFDKKMNGVYITQGVEQAANDVQLVEDSVGASVDGQAIGMRENGSNFGLAVNLDADDDNLWDFRIYQPVKAGSTHVFTWTYTLQHVAKKYTDIAEINWRIIGSQWAVTLHDVTINVQLPKTDLKVLRSWTHSDVAATFKADKGTGMLRYQAASVDAGVELHTMFDADALSAAPLSHGRDRAEILAQEQAILARKQAKSRRETVFGFLAFVPIVGAIPFVRSRRKYKQLAVIPNGDGRHVYDQPSDLAPAIVAWQLTGEKTDSEVLFSATLMDLLARRQLSVKPALDKGLFQRKETYDVRLESDAGLSAFEERFLEILFGPGYQVGQSINTKVLQKTNGPFSERYHADIDWFRSKVSAEAAPHSILDEDAQTYMAVWKMLAFASAVVGILLAGVGFIISLDGVTLQPIILIGVIFNVLFLGSVWYFASSVAYVYTKDGLQVARDWRGFGTMLGDIGQTDIRKVPDVTLWDRYLAYAVVLGVADHVSATLEQANIDTATDDAAFHFYVIFSPSNIANYATVATESSSGGSFGGGGSSGGFGGNSGGGAF